MCYICRLTVCHSACPGYGGYSLERGRPIAHCEECGRYIYGDGRNDFFEFNGRFFCAECAVDLPFDICDPEEEVG